MLSVPFFPLLYKWEQLVVGVKFLVHFPCLLHQGTHKYTVSIILKTSVFFICNFLTFLTVVSLPLVAFCEWISFAFHKCSLHVCFSRTRDKRRDDGKWRDYDRYYDRSDLYRDKSSWRRGRSKSRSKSRGLSRSRSRSRGRSKDHDANRNVGEYSRCCFRGTSNVSDVWGLLHIV